MVRWFSHGLPVVAAARRHVEWADDLLDVLV
jgi:hypothetical protein